MVEDLSAGAIEAQLTGRFGRPLRVLDVTGSTNTDALAWAEEGAPEGAVVVADQQTAGRGRWGRSWLSEPGTSLLFSLVLRPPLPRARIGLLPTAVGLGCAVAVEELAHFPVRLKWPNDVMSRGRKLAGILVETRVVGGDAAVAVCGVGLNVHQRPEDLPPEIADLATSIAAEAKALSSGPVPDRSELLGAILWGIEDRRRLLTDLAASEDLIAEATERSEVIGRSVALVYPDGLRVHGLARRLLVSGALELDTPAGPLEIEGGEIETLRPA